MTETGRDDLVAERVFDALGRGVAGADAETVRGLGRTYASRLHPAQAVTADPSSRRGAAPSPESRRETSAPAGVGTFDLRLPARPVTGVGPVDRLVGRLPSRSHRRGRRRLVVPAWPEHFIARELQRTGLAGYEPETLGCFLAALDAAPDGWVYDIGANIGAFAVLAAALGNRPVVAFEPTPVLAAAARSIRDRNDLHIDVEEVALGREAGIADFYLSDTSDASNSLAAGFRPSSRTLTVRVDTLDAFAARTGRWPGLIKVDTETTEADVLAGATQVIERRRPWLLVEILHGRREEDLTSVVKPFGYCWYHITDAVPAPRRDVLAGDATHRYRNWLLTPGLPDARFWRNVRRWRSALAECQP